MTMDHIVYWGLGTALTDMTRPILGRARGVGTKRTLSSRSSEWGRPLWWPMGLLEFWLQEQKIRRSSHSLQTSQARWKIIAPSNPRDLRGYDRLKGRTLNQWWTGEASPPKTSFSRITKTGSCNVTVVVWFAIASVSCETTLPTWKALKCHHQKNMVVRTTSNYSMPGSWASSGGSVCKMCAAQEGRT